MMIIVYDLRFFEQVRFIGTMSEVAKEMKLSAKQLNYVLRNKKDKLNQYEYVLVKE